MMEKMTYRLKTLAATALAAALLAACSPLEGARQEEDAQRQEQQALAFGAYLNRPTRAGYAGPLSTEALKDASLGVGFGVMATYTGIGLYSRSEQRPNFMYNQKVQWSSSAGAWEYSPIKYWPNGLANPYGEETTCERLSIFAYAPWVAVNEDTGLVADSSTDGITGLGGINATGDPMVYFSVPMAMDRQVDLCWGTSDGQQTISGGGSSVTIADGMPLLDMTRMDSHSGTVDVRFHHALSKLNVTVDALVDGVPAIDLDGNTRIYIRSVSFTGFTLSGALNLRNTVASTPRWGAVNGGALPTAAVVFNDGRMDGSEGKAVGGGNSGEANQLLNPALVQVDTYTNPGVTTAKVNLFGSATLTDPVYVIPTGGDMDVTVVYDVETRDAKLKGHYLSDGVTEGHISRNRVTANGVFASLAAGKSYTLNIHVGVTSVKTEARVYDWDSTTQNMNL